MKKLTIAITCFVLLIVSATGAWASAIQITLSSSALGSVVFTGINGLDGQLRAQRHVRNDCQLRFRVRASGTISDTWQLPNVDGRRPWDAYVIGWPRELLVSGRVPTLWLSATFGGNTLLTQLAVVDLFGGTGKAPSFQGTFGPNIGYAVPGFPCGLSGDIDFTIRLREAPSIATLGSGSRSRAFSPAVS